MTGRHRDGPARARRPRGEPAASEPERRPARHELARQLDPRGRRALFSTPPQAAPDRLRPGRLAEGRQAFYSTGPRQPGTVVVVCSSCESRRRISLVELGVRLLRLSVWLPGRRHGHWMRCPGCHTHRWCEVVWK